ncbi:hypothetical protein ACFP2T_27040 [Plantactinospora solaniradicis]|uniref:Tetratricopeptide repeat protein n=1 Tax=Plantactinospora solaniradicis TaxID=1723736 RepID=A0ABW1KDH9_9ACTN
MGRPLRARDPESARTHWQRALGIYTELGVPEAEEMRSRLDELPT